MKSHNVKLLVSLMALAAIILTTTPHAEAQRRESQNRNESEKKDERQIKNTVEQKSTFRESDTGRRNSGSTTVRSQPRVPEKSADKPVRQETRSSNSSERPAAVPANRGNAGRNSQGNAAVREREQPARTSNPRGNSTTGSSNSNVQKRVPVRESVRQPQVNTPATDNNRYRNSSRNSSSNVVERPTPRNNIRSSREMYRLDRNDQHYSVNRNFKGRNETWSASYRNNHKHYNSFNKKYYKKYNYHTYDHWNNDWENYRWNVSSWVDYYDGYHPYSFTYHRHYYHHPVYGHVIRRFKHRPDVFVVNHRNLYVYDGHFFRHVRGVGYVLVDMPYGLMVNYLPDHYQRVYINGFPYFRVGNLFFEPVNHGFRLVHYPERYFAYRDDFHHGGYYFEDLYPY